MLIRAVDLFCGAGGLSRGIIEAARERGHKLDLVAVNHWDTAINSHSLNHPTVRHICEPVENLWPARVVPGRRLNLLAAGVECTYHSLARGGGPCKEQSRSQAWQLIRWLTDIRVDGLQMENVRVKSYAKKFVTDTRCCNLGELAILLNSTPNLPALASSHRWLESVIMEIGTFDGDLIFRSE